jgi:DNA phosphorothioation-associated putative methyltransferase
LISAETTVFDYGCGQGDDVRFLQARGIPCSGWDPIHRPDDPRSEADLVNLGYVINVIERPDERTDVLRRAWSLARRVLVVTARLTVDARNPTDSTCEDGCLTRINTFQKYYEQSELRSWIDSCLGHLSVPAAPGVFYVFRDPLLRESFVASRYRRRGATPRLRKSDVLFEEHRELLKPLINFLATRGRLPGDGDLFEAQAICDEFGSLRRAYAIIRRASGDQHWDQIREERSQDLLIYLALSRFGGRPKFSGLPHDIRLDVRAFFTTYNRACAEADALLFSAGNPDDIDEACRSAQVGKLMPTALYLHDSALPLAPPVLRVYEGCARNYIGSVEGANILKLHRGVPQISYLSYPDFESVAHPNLHASLTVDLQTFRVRYRSYRESENPFVLHRKEEFVHETHPLRDKFAKLTRQEVAWGLFANTSDIGTRQGWEQILAVKGATLAGHRLLRARR